MADDPITPTAGDTPRPAPRRRAPRKASPAGPSAPRTRKAPPKVETATDDAVAEPADAHAARSRPVERAGGRWGVAAIIGGLAVAGAAAAALTLWSSTPRRTDPSPAESPDGTGHAHQADGTDASASFDAGIADEGTIPEA